LRASRGSCAPRSACSMRSRRSAAATSRRGRARWADGDGARGVEPPRRCERRPRRARRGAGRGHARRGVPRRRGGQARPPRAVRSTTQRGPTGSSTRPRAFRHAAS
jgi:hypothetical protein